MTNIEKYNAAFVEVFAVSEEILNENFTSEKVEGWDSVKQLSLTVAIEDNFDIMLDPEDIMAFKAYVIGKEILTKYDIEL